jgi:hypothetical protein
MSPRSLFKIILKVFGLFFIREIIISLSQFISSVILYMEAGRISEMVFTLAINAIVIFFYGFIVSHLLFNTNNILDKFKLDQGFDEEDFSFEDETKKGQFSIGISSTFVLIIALLVLAGVILVNEIPHLFRLLFIYMMKSKSYENTDTSFLIISVVKILIALLLIGERKRIVELIQKK